MTLYQKESMSIEEYFLIRESSDELLEYIDGLVYMSPSPSTKHQRISGKLYLALGRTFEGKLCEVFPAPYDIELKSEDVKGIKIIIPDISVICDKTGFTDARYVGIPSLIIEILSPSNQSHDLITKLNLYMSYGVKEYWIVSPMLNAVTVYSFNDEKMYEQYDMKIDTGKITSKLFDDLSVDVSYLFGD